MNKILNKPELLAPAGTPEKLKTAFLFGADAAYLGLKKFSMRQFAKNFTLDQLAWAVDYANDLGKKIYLTLNVQPYDHEFHELEALVSSLKKIQPHAVIVGDPGVFAQIKQWAPHWEIHLSTQMGILNAPSANFWFKQGAHRIILARELNLNQLKTLTQKSQGPLETFIHGAVCVAFSGRCLMSLYWAGRDPRKGACAQSCRWPYVSIQEARHPERTHEILQDERGTYFFDGRDLSAMPLLDQLLELPLASLKIEGRSRSEHYVGITVDAYRHAMNLIASGEKQHFRNKISYYQSELQRAAKRGFSTHFLGNEHNDPQSYQPQGSPVGGSAVFVGKVENTSSDYIDVRLKHGIKRHVRLEIRSPGMVLEHTSLDVIYDIDQMPLDMGRAGDLIRIFGAFRAVKGALVRMASPGHL